jgi:hypothetical protein
MVQGILTVLTLRKLFLRAAIFEKPGLCILLLLFADVAFVVLPILRLLSSEHLLALLLWLLCFEELLINLALRRSVSAGL